MEEKMMQPADVTDEREAFEAFAQNCPMGKYSITRRGDDYDSSHTQLMWDAWQARAQVQGEPFAWVEHHKGGDNLVWDEPGGRKSPLYTTPQQPKPQPMTDDEIEIAYQHTASKQSFMSFRHGIRSAEAHHGITAQAKKEQA